MRKFPPPDLTEIVRNRRKWLNIIAAIVPLLRRFDIIDGSCQFTVTPEPMTQHRDGHR